MIDKSMANGECQMTEQQPVFIVDSEESQPLSPKAFEKSSFLSKIKSTSKSNGLDQFSELRKSMQRIERVIENNSTRG